MGSPGCPPAGRGGGEGSQGAGCAQAAPSPPRLGGTAAPRGTCWGFSQPCQPGQTGRQPSDARGGIRGWPRGCAGAMLGMLIPSSPRYPAPRCDGFAAVPPAGRCAAVGAHTRVCGVAMERHNSTSAAQKTFFINLLAPCSSVARVM